MKRKLLGIVFFVFLFVSQGRASHIGGGEITYKYIGNNKFDVTFKFYRDCRGGSLYSPTFELICVASSARVNLTATSTSIKDISSVCASAGKCDPANTSVTSSLPLFEEHIYTTTLDFDGIHSSFKNCCTLKIGMGQCCRTNGITTGGAGDDFWVTSTLELCNAPTNSSPEFSYVPAFIGFCNQPLFWDFLAKDTIDNDSLSYSFTDPLGGWYSKTSWSSAYNSQNPATVYYPSGYDKSKGPKPDANPPIGIYLDPIIGKLVFTPTDCSERTILAVSVKEWRRDSTGKYQVIGEIIRDMMLNVITSPSYNNRPTISGSYKYIFCEGILNSFDIVTDDKAFIPQPPLKPNPPDSTTITWDNGIKGASFGVVSDTARCKIGRFSWTPPSGLSGKTFKFTVTVKDNFCPLNAVITASYTITVRPNIKLNHSLTKLNDYTYLGKGGPDTSYKGNYTQSWDVLDSTGKSVLDNIKRLLFNPYNLDKNNNLFYKLLPSGIDHLADTIVFRKNGRYIISHTLGTNTYCPKTINDTIVVRNIGMLVSLVTTIDTSICEKTNTRLRVKIVNGQKPYSITWKAPGILKTDTSEYLDYLGNIYDFIEVQVRDALNNVNSTVMFIYQFYTLPKFKVGNDTSICLGNEVKLKGKPIYMFQNFKNWEWRSDTGLLNKTDSLSTKLPGRYILSAQSISTSCVGRDTINIYNFPQSDLVLIDNTYCQKKNEVSQNEIFQLPVNPNVFQNIKWSLIKSIKKPSGNLNSLQDLLFDEDTSASYNFKIKINPSLLDLKISKQDSLKFSVLVEDSNHCISSDNMTIRIIKNPDISITQNPYTICRNNSLNLKSSMQSDGNLTYFTFDKSLYDSWPSSGEILNGTKDGKYFKEDGGKYFVRISSDFKGCNSFDSLDIFIKPSPIPIVIYSLFYDSIRFTDSSLYANTRKWFLNNTLIGSSKSIILTKAATDGVPVRLELNYLTCKSDTTITLNTLVTFILQNQSIKIYPNPTNDFLMIEQLGKTLSTNYKVFNMLGELIQEGNLNQNETGIDMTNLSRGPYLIRIANDYGSSTFQFIKY